MKRNYIIGIGFKLLNCLFFPIISLMILHSSASIDLNIILFLQSSFGAIFTLSCLLCMKKKISFSISRIDFLFYFARAMVNLMAIKAWIISLQHLGINEATAFSYTGPLWVFLMASSIGEKFNIRIFALICANILGMLAIIAPNSSAISLQGAIYALCAMFLWSIYEVICKKQTSTQHYALQSFYFLAISSLISFPFAFPVFTFINLNQVTFLICTSIISVANITVIFLAYSKAPITLLSPFSYMRLLFTGLISYFLYGSSPTSSTFLGGAIIMLSNAYLLFQSHKIQETN